MTVEIQQTPAGLTIGVKAQPGGRTNAVRGEHAGMLRVSVTQAPEKGKANGAIIEVLCDALGLRRSQIELIAGDTNAKKRFLIREIAADELQRRLEQAAGGSA